MPIGIIANSSAIVIGGVIGAVAGEKISEDFKEKMNMAFGASAMAMGISSIVLMENMPAVIFAMILGTILGMVIHLGEWINRAGGAMQRMIGKFVKTDNSRMSEQEFMEMLLTMEFRMIRVKMFPTADMIPAMILVMPLSMIWANYIMPLVS